MHAGEFTLAEWEREVKRVVWTPQPSRVWRPQRGRGQRQGDRAQGVDRYGNPLPRIQGTNPRALRSKQAGGSGEG